MKVFIAPPTWAGVNSVAVGDKGRVFAGEYGASLGVAAWNADGSLAWERSFPRRTKSTLFNEVLVQLVDKVLVVQVRDQNFTESLELLDPATGKTLRKLKTPPTGAFRIAGDRIVTAGYEVHVLSYPAMKKLAAIELNPDSNQFAASRDGRWFAINDTDCHVIDAKKAAHVRSFPLDADVDALAFTHDGQLIAGDSKARLRFYDVKTGKRTGEVGLSRGSQTPRVLAVAASADYIVASLKGGTCVMLDAKTRKIHERSPKFHIKKGGASILGSGVLGFAFHEKRLYMGATLKRNVVGVSSFPAD